MDGALVDLLQVGGRARNALGNAQHFFLERGFHRALLSRITRRLDGRDLGDGRPRDPDAQRPDRGGPAQCVARAAGGPPVVARR